MIERPEWDTYKVLPHRDILDCSLYSGGRAVFYAFEHELCGMALSKRDIEANWCPSCCATLNKAADKRAIAARMP